MTFTGWPYALFVAAIWVVHWFGPRQLRTVVLLIASYLFYAAWEPRFLILILATTGLDFLVAKRIFAASGKRRTAWFLLSVGANLGVLGYFKYAEFFVESTIAFLSELGFHASPSSLRIALPIGISFYTFQTLGYSFDVFRAERAPESNFITFATFVAFFPQLVAGPIERASSLLPQLATTKTRPDTRALSSAMALITLGVFKKTVLADQAALVANATFGDPSAYSSPDLAIGVVAFAIQIYMDFSAYTDIARGTARLFGVELQRNFFTPYRAQDLQDFWRRWHVSLSTWLRDYLYRPLGGNRHGQRATYRNLLLTMLLGGLWHGADEGFVLWGLLHGLGLALVRYRSQHQTPAAATRLPAARSVGKIYTLAFVVIAWIPFRAQGIRPTADYILALLGNGFDTLQPAHALLIASLALAVTIHDVLREHTSELVARLRSNPALAGWCLGTAWALVVLFSARTAEPFLYLRF